MSFEDAKKGNDITSIETEAAERELKVRQFLAESLPPTEDRIQEPMNPRCEVCVVLPAYSERGYILRPLTSLATQEGVSPDQYEVIVVVNNPPIPPAREQFETEEKYKNGLAFYAAAIADNQETLNLVRDIGGGQISVALTDEERASVENIRRSGLRLFVIDKASTGKTLPEGEANVGGARNRGVAEAVERFHNQIRKNGVIAQSDAEVRFPKSYIGKLIKIFGDDPELIGISGEVAYEDTLEDENLFTALSTHGEAEEVYKNLEYYLQSVITGKWGEDLDFLGAFDGSNMASRAQEAALVGGVPKLAGAEDTVFGMRLKTIGKTREAPELETVTLRRFSPRTTTGRGQRHIKIAEGIKSDTGLVVENPEVVRLYHAKTKEFTDTIMADRATPESISNIFTIDGRRIFDDEQFSMVLDEVAKVRGLQGQEAIQKLVKSSRNNIAGLETILYERIAKTVPDIPLQEAATKLLEIIADSDALLKSKYSSRREEFIRESIAKVNDHKRELNTLLDIIFENKPTTLNADSLRNVITENREKLEFPEDEMERLFRRETVLVRLAEIITRASTKQEAFDSITARFASGLSHPAEGTLGYKTMEMHALAKAITDLHSEQNTGV